MKRKQFLLAVEKLKSTNLIYVLPKGKKGQESLGATYIGDTEAQNINIWRKYGCLYNIIIHKTAEEVNAVLVASDILDFVAVPTKSGNSCRLKNNSIILNSYEKYESIAINCKKELLGFHHSKTTSSKSHYLTQYLKCFNEGDFMGCDYYINLF